MARIRTIKPEFFRHETLQDLEATNPSQHIMLVYIALWTQADVNGVFPWKPRVLKLDILPFLNFELLETLHTLEKAGFIARFETDGTEYGHIISFRKHQRFGGKEAQEKGRYPTPPATGKQQGSNREAAGKQQGMQERNMEYKERNMEEGVSAPAHEEKIFSSTSDIIEEVTNHLRNDNWASLSRICEQAGYDPDQLGPVRDEVKKFCAHHAERMTRDPVAYFCDKFIRWLIDAKQYNKPRNRGSNARPYPTASTGRRGPQSITELLR